MKYIENNKHENIFHVVRPYIPLHIKPFLHLGKVTKNLYPYFMEINKKTLPIEVQWSLELKLTCSPSLWNIIYKTCFKSINANVYKWFQYKIIRKIIATKIT